LIPLLTFGASTPFSTGAGRPPNFVIILTDDQGYADVGVYGAKGFKTPNLDHLARDGIRFTDFHVAQPVCSASRAALLTGCYPSRVGIMGALGPHSRIGLSPGEVTLAELLKPKGYATAIFGKWHLGDRPEFLPTRQGFDEYFGLPYSNDMWPAHPEAKPGTYPPLPLFEQDRILNTNVASADQCQLTTWYTEHAVEFIERHHAQPFLLYVAHSMPHVPLHVSDKFRGRSQQGLYGDVIMELDWSVGEILAALKRFDLERDTLVMFMSDNGPWLSYGDHAGSAGRLREGKGTSWEGGTRVPFIARWSGRIPRGSACREPAMTIDLFPTIARLAGAELPAHAIDGLDIWPLLSGDRRARNPHDAYFFYYGQNELQAVRSGRWKLVLPHSYTSIEGQALAHGGVPTKYRQVELALPELYDLQRDPGERRNVADNEPVLVRHLEALAEGARGTYGDSPTRRIGTGVREPGRAQSAVP
jgi:arylsulfatase A